MHGRFVLTIRQVSLAMYSKMWKDVPLHFDWSMWLEVREIWCAFMMIVVVLAWQQPFLEFCLLVVMASVLVLIAIYDIRYGLIYDRLVLLLLLLGLIPMLCGYIAWESACLGALLGGSLLAGLRFLSHGGLGLGDVKLAVPLGMWLGWENLFLCLLLASVSGLIYGGWLLLCHRMQRKSPLPFGPFLAWGALAAFGWGHVIREYIEGGLCW